MNIEGIKEAVEAFENALRIAYAENDDKSKALTKELSLKLKRARKILHIKKEQAEKPKKQKTKIYVKSLLDKML